MKIYENIYITKYQIKIIYNNNNNNNNNINNFYLF